MSDEPAAPATRTGSRGVGGNFLDSERLHPAGGGHVLRRRVGVDFQSVWYYPEPKDAAREIARYVAFWKGVTVTA